MDEAVREVLEFLIVNGPARNEVEREQLLALIRGDTALAADELVAEPEPATEEGQP